MQALRLAGRAVRLSGAALRQTKIDRLQGGGVAAPAVSSFLERERLSDLHPVCDRKTVPGLQALDSACPISDPSMCPCNSMPADCIPQTATALSFQPRRLPRRFARLPRYRSAEPH